MCASTPNATGITASAALGQDLPVTCDFGDPISAGPKSQAFGQPGNTAYRRARTVHQRAMEVRDAAPLTSTLLWCVPRSPDVPTHRSGLKQRQKPPSGPIAGRFYLAHAGEPSTKKEVRPAIATGNKLRCPPPRIHVRLFGPGNEWHSTMDSVSSYRGLAGGPQAFDRRFRWVRPPQQFRRSTPYRPAPAVRS